MNVYAAAMSGGIALLPLFTITRRQVLDGQRGQGVEKRMARQLGGIIVVLLLVGLARIIILVYGNLIGIYESTSEQSHALQRHIELALDRPFSKITTYHYFEFETVSEFVCYSLPFLFWWPVLLLAFLFTIRGVWLWHMVSKSNGKAKMWSMVRASLYLAATMAIYSYIIHVITPANVIWYY